MVKPLKDADTSPVQVKQVPHNLPMLTPLVNKHYVYFFKKSAAPGTPPAECNAAAPRAAALNLQ